MRYTVSYKDSSFGEVSFDVEMKKTSKTATIKPIDAKPKYGYGDFPLPGCIDRLWDLGEMKFRLPGPCFKEWDDGTYTIYPCGAGIPFLLTPEKEE